MNLLQKYKEQSRLTNEQIARKLGCSASHVDKVLNNRRPITRKITNMIIDATANDEKNVNELEIKVNEMRNEAL